MSYRFHPEAEAELNLSIDYYRPGDCYLHIEPAKS